MGQLVAYIVRTAAGPCLFVTMVLTGIIWIVQALRFVDEIINYDMSTGAFLYISFLLLPQLLPVTMPIGLFCGMLYAYWRLSADSELVVMRAAGLSRISVAKPGLLLGGICAVFVASMTFYFMPLANSTMRDTRFAWKYIYSTIVLREGAFTPLKDNLTVYVSERRPGGELHGLLIHDDRDPGKAVSMMAEQGTMIRSDEGPKILLLNGNRQERDLKTGDVSLLYFDRYNLETDVFSAGTPIRRQKIEERNVAELFTTSSDDVGAAQISKYRAEGHRRIALPLLTIAFALVAVATVLSGEFDRRGSWKRLWLGCIGAGVLQGAVLGLLQAASTEPILIFVLYLVLFGAMGICVYLIRSGAGLRSVPASTAEAAG
ncbi:LPS export ABC transporter permease LptF [Minwuia sp.]|uniref:LPS export ABC transporter permease LptF n=1 Tax=Minwuia sp. TaxID=2493630 RepID=UPI003A8ED683